MTRKENQRLKENYERIYNENCILRENHSITDISLLDENQRLKEVLNEIKKYIEDNTYKTEWGDELQDNESLNINDYLTDEEFVVGILEILKGEIRI